jgi:hypothetical protein
MQYLAGFRMYGAQRKDGSVTVMDVVAIQDAEIPKVLTLMVALTLAPKDAPGPVPPAPRMPLVTATDVAAVFEQACVKPQTDAAGMVDFVLAQDARWLGDKNPIALRYMLDDGERVAAVSWLPDTCSVLVEHVTTADLRAAIEALVGRLEGVQEVPEANRPKAREDVRMLVAKRGSLPGDADNATLDVFLVSYGEGEGVNRHLIMLGRNAP